MNILERLPDTTGCVIILSGGLDSTIAMRLAVEKYGSKNVFALTFDYGQKQVVEIKRAKQSTQLLGVSHKVLNLSILGEIGQGFSANLDQNIHMPTIKEILGDPQPKTYVPNRNMILLSVAAAFAETKNVEYILTGLQATDQYGYWDTTQRFIDKMNNVLSENRKTKINIIAPFSDLSKKDELLILKEIDGNLDLTKHTLTCYNPKKFTDVSCGNCPSCSERIKAFMDIGEQDTIFYVLDPWSKEKSVQ